MTRAQEYERIRARTIEILEDFPGEDVDGIGLEETIRAKLRDFFADWHSEGGFPQSFIFFKALVEHPCSVSTK